MARSLAYEIVVEDDSAFKIDEEDNSTLSVDSLGTGSVPVKIRVTVDEIEDNCSFTVKPSDDSWMTCEIERVCDDDNDEGRVCILLRISKNLSTDTRVGSMTIRHNCARKVYAEIRVEQEGAKYSLNEINPTEDMTAMDENNEPMTPYNPWVFHTVPLDKDGETARHEDRIVSITANGGREKWYVKDIQQYLVQSDDDFDDTIEFYDGSQDGEMSQVGTSYDGCFNYWIEGNELHVRSYGQIDMTRASSHHMRYFFVICHSDVDNSNCDALDDNNLIYERKILFVFDGTDIEGYEQ